MLSARESQTLVNAEAAMRQAAIREAMDPLLLPNSDDDVLLLTPEWCETIRVNPHRDDPLCKIEGTDPERLTVLFRIGVNIISMPARVGDAQGEIIDLAPGVKGWGCMLSYGLRRLGPTVWELSPSLWIPGELHAFLVLCGVPEPPAFAQRSLILGGRP